MTRASRKLEHLKLALAVGQTNSSGFENIHFVHHSLPDIDLDRISLQSTIGGLNLSSPIIINAMTGGAEETEKINMKLAQLAKETKLAMAVGSQMSAIKNKAFRKSYQVVRKNHPEGIIIANLGGEASVEQAKEAIEMIEANALQIHLNVIQELVMPEGDRRFKGILENIQHIKESINVPLIVKEVGFGISKEAATKLFRIGANIIDVGGKGGTNFASIENRRRDIPISFFEHWGIETAISILETKSVNEKGIEIIATGGIDNSLDIVKAIGLGASAVGIAGAIIKKVYESDLSNTIKYIEELHHGIQLVMTALGAKRILDIQNQPMVILGETKDWCELRGIDISHIARRK